MAPNFTQSQIVTSFPNSCLSFISIRSLTGNLKIERRLSSYVWQRCSFLEIFPFVFKLVVSWSNFADRRDVWDRDLTKPSLIQTLEATLRVPTLAASYTDVKCGKTVSLSLAQRHKVVLWRHRLRESRRNDWKGERGDHDKQASIKFWNVLI